VLKRGVIVHAIHRRSHRQEEGHEPTGGDEAAHGGARRGQSGSWRRLSRVERLGAACESRQHGLGVTHVAGGATLGRSRWGRSVNRGFSVSGRDGTKHERVEPVIFPYSKMVPLRTLEPNSVNNFFSPNDCSSL
jgi:hypothetical protein